MIKIEKGSLHIHVAFDLGFELKLPLIREIFSGKLIDRAEKFRPVSEHLHEDIEPLRIAFDPLNIKLPDRDLPLQVFATFFELGALSLELTCPLDSDFDLLPKIAEELEDSSELVEASRQMAKGLFEKIKPAIMGPEFFQIPRVHYVAHLQKLSDITTGQQLLEKEGFTIAKALWASSERVGQSELKRALQNSLSYSDDDLVIVTQKGAVVFDEDGFEAVDILELANVQALELRFIDSKLDRTLVNLYEEVQKKPSFLKMIVSRFFDISEMNWKSLNTTHLDSLIISERVEQSFKLASDHYLAKVHELCVNAFYMKTMMAGVDGKLAAIRDIARDLQGRENNLRMETLEWIIIILILIGTLPLFYKIAFLAGHLLLIA